jgi:hypothetical protein
MSETPAFDGQGQRCADASRGSRIGPEATIDRL